MAEQLGIWESCANRSEADPPVMFRQSVPAGRCPSPGVPGPLLYLPSPMVAGPGFEPGTKAYETYMMPFQHPAIVTIHG